MRKLLPVLLAVIGIGAGVGAGIALRPSAEATASDSHGEEVACAPGTAHAATVAEAPPEVDDGPDAGNEYVRLNNQFVVPVVNQERVAALVVLSLSVEVASGESEIIYSREPKLRDVFLQVMFDHANAGGFSGAFTDARTMEVLRQELRKVTREVVGPIAQDVLITEINRQDV